MTVLTPRALCSFFYILFITMPKLHYQIIGTGLLSIGDNDNFTLMSS